MRAVVDTNVIAYSLLSTQPFAQEADSFWLAVSEPMAPSQWEAEMANVVWMAVRAQLLSAQDGSKILDLAARLGIHSVPNRILWHGALSRSVKSGVAVYDTLFVELADRDQARRIEASLYKLVNVLLVENITREPAIMRDLAMIKVAATHEARSHVLELASVFRARVVDVSPESLTLEITGAEDKIDGLLEVLRPYGVREMVRTGIVAMRRGNKAAATTSKTDAVPEVTSEHDVSHSV